MRMDTAVLDELSAWWDGVELWIVQLWFPFQFVVVMAVVVPVCLGAAWVVDRSVDWVAARLRSPRTGRKADQDVGGRTGE